VRRIQPSTFAAVAVIAFAAVAGQATASPPTGHGVLHSPHGSYHGHSSGYWIAQWWSGALSAPADESNPVIAGGCVRVGNVAIHYSGGDCSLPPGTAIFEMLFSTECSNREPAPFHAENAAEAEACGRANSGAATALDLRVDGGPWLHLLDEEFAAVIPWTTVAWPENNIFGLPGGGLISFGGYGYGALVNPLRVGRHTIDLHLEGEGAPPDSHAVITVG
jgi:hypothetical protein